MTVETICLLDPLAISIDTFNFCICIHPILYKLLFFLHDARGLWSEIKGMADRDMDQNGREGNGVQQDGFGLSFLSAGKLTGQPILYS